MPHVKLLPARRARNEGGQKAASRKGMAMKQLAEKAAQESQQFLTFLLEDQEYGLEIFRIR